MSSGLLTSQARPCPACRSSAGVVRGQKNGFPILSCRDCGTLYTASVPEQVDGRYYDRHYASDKLTMPEFINKRLDEIIAEFSGYRQTNRLLDVGCGAGVLLEAARRADWNAEGLDISAAAVKHVGSLGFKVFCGDISGAHYPNNYFDVVTASEVLEHVPDPVPMLTEIARVLRPGGTLWATTPHGKGIAARMLGLRWITADPPDHLHLFSTSGVKSMLKIAGFRRFQITTRGMNPFEIIRTLQTKRETTVTDNSLVPTISDRQLNEAFTKGSARIALKNMINGALNVSRLGDSLKIRAEK